MKELQTEIVIHASAQRIWDLLMDFDSYPDWNPFILEINGLAQEGNKLEVTLQPKGKAPMKFEPEVVSLVPQKEFQWKGKLWTKGLFDGAHYFRLEEIEETKTRFVHGEHFSGLLVGPILKMVGDATAQSFEEMNQALKEAAEKRA